MVSRTESEQKMILYLLGELSKEEQAELEETYLMDKNYFEQLQNVEDELIHKYLLNELSGNERERFERYFLSIPQNREKVKFAKALMIYLTKEQLQEQPTGATLRQRIVTLPRFVEALLTPKTPALKWAYAAAMFAMIFISSWLALEMKGMRTQLTQLEGKRHTLLQREQELRQEVDVQRKQSEELADQLRNEQNQRAELERKLSRQSPSKSDLFTVALIPGASRSAQEANKFKRSQIGQGEQLVKLLLYIGGQETYENYRAIFETAEGDTMWIQYQLRAQQTEKGNAIALLLPSNLLSYNDYLITVYGMPPSKEIEYVDSFYFNIAK